VTTEEITLFKDVIYPSVDIFLKVFAGIVLLIYLQKKSHKNELRGKLCEVYFSIIDHHDALYYHCSKVSFIKLFQYAPFKRASDKMYEIYRDAVSECVGNKYTTPVEANDVLIKLTSEYRKLYFLLRKKEYTKYFSTMRRDVEGYYISASSGELSHHEITKRLKIDINEVNKNIKELGEHFENHLITQDEFKQKIINELLPIISEIMKLSSDDFDNKVSKYSGKMVEYIDWYG
tara:strand:- start:359 stop:1057 length:699 start_codon:yes stop_codon:yes gene_type:complete